MRTCVRKCEAKLMQEGKLEDMEDICRELCETEMMGECKLEDR